MGTEVRVGSVVLPNPVMPASGTAGYRTELAAYGDLAGLGAVVVKSLSPYPWPGNPAPRLHAVGDAMVNSVGLHGPGLEAWRRDDLPALVATGARVVASVWGRTVEDYAEAAALLAPVADALVAVEVNLSCPNLQGKGMFAQSPDATAAAVAATAGCGRPRWAKLTPAVTDVVEIAAAAAEAGAEAVTLVNTMPALVLDPATGRAALGAGAGGLSGAALHPVAVRAVSDVHRALPGLPVVGVGGVASGHDAAELLVAGASAVQVGTATFADPRAPWRVLTELVHWCHSRGVRSVADLVGDRHGAEGPQR